MFFRGLRKGKKRVSRIHLSEVAHWPNPEYTFGFTGWKSMEDRGTGMECLDKVVIPLQRKYSGAMTPGAEMLRIMGVPVCEFELRHADTFVWYECRHCSSCGCPSFTLDKLREMPTVIWEHLQFHAELCSKLER